VACAADVLSGKWHPVVVSLLLVDPKGFAGLEDDVEGLSSTVLSSALQRRSSPLTTRRPSGGRRH